MDKIMHSVLLDRDKCQGCTNCIKTCPTQAIRVRNGKAKILKDKCIDCGECIRVCPYHAKKAVTDPFEKLNEYKYTVALPAPTLYGQFSNIEDIDRILDALVHIGFDDVYEVSYAAQIITEHTRRLMNSGMLEMPVINSACPAVVKLIATRFPGLINNVVPMISPMQLAAGIARKEACEKTSLPPEDIGVFFITPCAAKATCAHDPIGLSAPRVDGVFSIKDTYLKMLPYLKGNSDIPKRSKSSFAGVGWANSGGEASSAENRNYIAVDGIHNVLKILEEIDNNKLRDVKFIELLACVGGCVGGPLNVENNFVAKRRIKNIAAKLKDSPACPIPDVEQSEVLWSAPISFKYESHLDENMIVAMQKLKKIEDIYNNLPKLDCGSCGSPTCRCLAEDIVRGYTTEEACIVKFKEKMLKFAKEVISIEEREEE